MLGGQGFREGKPGEAPAVPPLTGGIAHRNTAGEGTGGTFTFFTVFERENTSTFSHISTPFACT